MRIIVVGAGAMGCLYGGELKDVGHDVVLIDVWHDQIEAINKNGLKIERNNSTKIVKIPANYAHEISREAQLILLFTKTYHSEKALESVKHLIGKQTYVLTLQNGLDNVEKIKKFVELNKIIVGITTYPSDLISPGYIASHGTGNTMIMSADGKNYPVLNNICQAFNDAGLCCEVSTDVFIAIWEKVAFNAALNAITAATKLKVGPVGSLPEGRSLAMKIAGEVVKVANCKGINAKSERVYESIENAFKHHGEHMPSMLQDVLSKRPTEVDSINGAVVREAKKMNLSAPTTETLYLLIRILEQTYEKQIII